MYYKQFIDAVQFHDSVIEIVRKQESESNILLRNLIDGKNGYSAPEWYMAHVFGDNNETLLAALMTPPFNLTLCLAENACIQEVLSFFSKNVSENNIPIPGVNAINRIAEAFAEIYAEDTGKKYETHMKLRIYNLHSASRDIKLTGSLRIAEEQDLAFLPYWRSGFLDDSFPDEAPHSISEAYEAVKRQLENKSLYILEIDGAPVSLAGIARKTVKSRAVSSVYTPPYFRNKGYATSCVAYVSQMILDMNYEYALLFTDLANPTSNSIYQKIGYKPVCDYLDIRFI